MRVCMSNCMSVCVGVCMCGSLYRYVQGRRGCVVIQGVELSVLMSSVAVSKIQWLRWSGRWRSSERCEGRRRGGKEIVWGRSNGTETINCSKLPFPVVVMVSDMVSRGGATSFFSEK